WNTEAFGNKLRESRLMALTMAVRSGEDLDGADGIDADLRRFPQADAGPETSNRLRGRDAASLDVTGEADAAQLALGFCLGFARGKVRVIDCLQRRVQRRTEIAGVVGKDHRRLMRELRDEILPTQF